ncbi:MAG: response regulator [Alphaproteobacteria bacterium]|nr:response regulator [Alphaproteobacteria bacterium]
MKMPLTTVLVLMLHAAIEGILGFIALSRPGTLVFLCFFIVTILLLVSVFIVLGAQHNHKETLQQLGLIQAISATLSQNQEIAVFDEKGKTLFTTHPHLYQHQKEFLRKLLMKVTPSNESVTFKQWVEDHHTGEVLLVGGGNGLGQQQRWWRAEVSPIDPLTVGGRHLVLVSLTEMTKYFDGYSQLKQNYHQMEKFLDFAPFGIFYRSQTGHLVGANSTLSQWLCVGKDQALGRPLQDFIDDYEKKITENKVVLVTIRPYKSQPFKAFLFPSHTNSNKFHASLLCRIDPGVFPSSSTREEVHFNQSIFTQAPVPAVIAEKTGKIIAFNPAYAAMISDLVLVDQDTLKIGDNLYDLIHTSLRPEVTTKLHLASTEQGPVTPFEVRFEGGKTFTTAYISRLDDSLENPLRGNKEIPLLIQFIDISEQKRLEQQFIQSQKMQAVGQLAGGIAHDFNNLLTAMIGFCDLLLHRYMPNDPSYTDVVQIKQNANRAANLVRQLLAFSRQQNLQPKVINVTDTLAELSALLRRLIGAGTDLQMIHGRDLWPVKVDASQLEQVIINLAVNARDAMPQGGTLVIRTGHYQCHRQHRIGHDLVPAGDYVLVEAIDTGCGIASEHLEHIFEPFFSTKEVGSGTGLGLSTVYGIVKQTGGFVSVESEVGSGTTFKIFLPRYVGPEQVYTIHAEQPSGDLTGAETILLVEDEDAVRLFSTRALREKGYRVLEANSGESALEIVQKGEKFDLLITDVVMPKMDGPTLSKKIRDLLPETKVIFISGYTEDTFRKNLDHDAQIHFLPKPFTLKDLATKVKEVLNANGMK